MDTGPEVSPGLPLLCIVGPTGSGKSALGLDAARRLRGEIISCDSLQLYRGFTIGTAKLELEERAEIPHHLMDVLDPREVCSAGDYARLARRAISEVSARGSVPVVVGGAGFYLRALLDGLPALPERHDELRERLIRRRPGSLWRILSRLDADAGQRIHPHDIQKLVRALEVRLVTGQTAPRPSEGDALKGYRVLKIGLDPPREDLYRYLEQRAGEMFEKGLVEEVAQLMATGLTGDEKPFESLGYKEAVALLRGGITRAEAIAATQLETRRYAKRQRTWFRRDRAIHWIHGFGGSGAAMQECAQTLQEYFGNL